MLKNFFIVNNDLKFLIPEVYIITSLLIFTLVFVFYSNFNVYKYTKLTKPLKNLIIINTIIYLFLTLNNINYNYIISSYLIFNDNYVMFFKILIIFFFIILIHASYNNLKSYKIYEFEFYILFYLSLISMLILIMAYDFIITYLAIELQSLCFYILISINNSKFRNSAIEASLKYFILGSFSSCLMLFGILIIYGITGMTNFKDLSDLFELSFNSNIFNDNLIIGFLFINIGFFFKLSIAPFHLWLPDIYEGSTKILIALFATLPKIALIFLLNRIYNVILIKMLLNWQFIFFFFIVLSWVIGLIGALKTFKINRIIAYSSINHIGFILIPLITNNFENLYIYIFIYIINSLTIFFILFYLKRYDNYSYLNNIYQMTYFKKVNFIASLSFTIALFSIAGIPPLAGFFGKFFIFMDAINFNFNFFVMIGLLISTISCFYYLRIIKLINFNNFKKWLFLENSSKSLSYFINFGLIFNIFFIFFLPFINEMFKNYYLLINIFIL